MILSSPGGLAGRSRHAAGELNPLHGITMQLCRLNSWDTPKACKGRTQDQTNT